MWWLTIPKKILIRKIVNSISGVLPEEHAQDSILNLLKEIYSDTDNSNIQLQTHASSLSFINHAKIYQNILLHWECLTKSRWIDGSSQ